MCPLRVQSLSHRLIMLWKLIRVPHAYVSLLLSVGITYQQTLLLLLAVVVAGCCCWCWEEGGCVEDGNEERYECHDMFSGGVLCWNCKFCGWCCRSIAPSDDEGRRNCKSSSWALDKPRRWLLLLLLLWPGEGVAGELVETGEFESLDGGRCRWWWWLLLSLLLLLFTNPFSGWGSKWEAVNGDMPGKSSELELYRIWCSWWLCRWICSSVDIFDRCIAAAAFSKCSANGAGKCFRASRFKGTPWDSV